MEVTSLEDEHGREKQRLVNKYEEEKRVLNNDFKKQLESLAQKHAKDKQMALDDLESELKRKFADEKRDFEIRWASERNVAERQFAEEKMAIMERLQVKKKAYIRLIKDYNNVPLFFSQTEFEMELKRVKFSSKVSPANSLSDVSASHSLTVGERQRFEKALNEKSQLETSLHSLVQEIEVVKSKLNNEILENTRLKNVLDEFQSNADEKQKTTRQLYETANEQLKSEIRRLNDDSLRLLNEIEQLRINLDTKKKIIFASTGVQIDLLKDFQCVDCTKLTSEIQQMKNDQQIFSANNKVNGERFCCSFFRLLWLFFL